MEPANGSDKAVEVPEPESRCSKCGKQTLCEYWENGAPTVFNDNFRHTCTDPACGFIEENLDVYGGQVGYEDRAYCPFCHRKCA